MQLKDQVAVVTGAKRGIGLAIAQRFVAEGAKVILADVLDTTREVKEIEAKGGAVLFVHTDVSNEHEVNAMIGVTQMAFGRLDILVNNAGIEFAKTVDTTTEAEWNRLMDVNLKGMFLCAKAAIPVMRSQGKGVIINVASELGLVGAAGVAAYCASKGGVVQLSRAMAVDHAKDGIRVNCLCPGPIATKLLEDIFAEAPDPDKMRKGFEQLTLLKRLGTPEEMASVALFLASEESSFITGANLVADGGWTTT